jgi:hypothetical protein
VFTYGKKERLDGRIFLMSLPKQFLAVLNELMNLVLTYRRILGERREVLRNQDNDDIRRELW